MSSHITNGSSCSHICPDKQGVRWGGGLIVRPLKPRYTPLAAVFQPKRIIIAEHNDHGLTQ